MPSYKVNNDIYDILDSEVESFEADYPDAKLQYKTDDGEYEIFASERKSFLSDYPNAIAVDWGGTSTENLLPDLDQSPNPPLADNKPERGFRAGARESWKGLKAGTQFAYGEAANALFGSSDNDANALYKLDEMLREGKDVNAEVEGAWTDAGRELRTGLLEFLPAVGFNKLKERVRNEAEQQRVFDDIREVIGEAGGDIARARELLVTRAQDKSYGDIQKEKAMEKFGDINETEGFGAWVGENVIQMIPSASALIVGALTKSPGAARAIGMIGMGGMTASTAGSSMYEARQAGASDYETRKVGIVDGALEYITEKLPFDNYTNWMMGRAKSKVTSDLARALRSGNKPLRNELEDLLKAANKELGGKLFSKKNLSEYVADMIAEGASEFTAEASQTMTRLIYDNPELFPLLGEAVSNGAQGALAGFFMGGILGGASNTMAHQQNKKRRQEQGFVEVGVVNFGTAEKPKNEIVEVLSVDEDTQRATVLRNGAVEYVDKNALGQSYRYSYEAFEAGRMKVLESEAIDNLNVSDGMVIAAKERVKATEKALTDALYAHERSGEEIADILQNENPAIFEEDELQSAYNAYREARNRQTELLKARNKQKETERGLKRSNIEEATGGKFWKEEANNKENGVVTYDLSVEYGELQDGRRVYILSDVNEAGECAAVTEDGQKMIVKADMLKNGTTIEKFDDYLDNLIANDKKAAEQQRMSEQTKDRVAMAKAAAQPGVEVELGTKEERIKGQIVEVKPDGVTVAHEGGASELTWEEFANSNNIGNPVLSDDETSSFEASEILSAESSYNATQTSNAAQAEDVISEASDAENLLKAAEPLPLKADGSVDQTTLWNQNPERWAEWNDEQRQDGGANSLNYINVALAKEQAKLAKAETSYKTLSDFETRDAMEKSIATIRDRVARLTALQQKYVPAVVAPTESAPVESAPTSVIAPEVESQDQRVRQTLAELYNDDSLSEAEIEEYIAQNASGSQADLDKHISKAPKMGRDMEKYKKAKAEHAEKTKELEAERDFWKSMQEYISVAESDMDMEPQNALEFTANELTRKDGIKLQRDSFIRHTGYGSEAGNFLSLLRTKKNGGLTLEEAGERLMEMDRENGTGFFDQNDPNAGLNAILDVLGGAKTSGDVSGYIKANREQMAREAVAATRNAMAEELIQPEVVVEATSELEGDLPVDIFPDVVPLETRLRTEQTSEGSGKFAEIKERAAAWAKRLGVKVNVLEDVSQVEDEAARDAISRGVMAAGWFDPKTGEVYIYAPHNPNELAVDKTIIHEVLSHKGLRGLLGEKGFNALCDAVWKDMSAEAKAKYLQYENVLSKDRLAEYQANPEAFEPTDKERRAAADEFIARYSESVNTDKNAWQKMIDSVKRFIHKVTGNYTWDEYLDELIEGALMRYESIAKLDLKGVAEEGAAYKGVMDAETGTFLSMAAKGRSAFNIKTEGTLEKQIRDYAKSKEGREAGWTEEKTEAIIKETQDLIKAIHTSSTGNEFYDEFATKDPTIRVDWRDGADKPIVTWTRANIEYKYDMSADLLCINNEGLEEVLSSDKMVALMSMFIPKKKAKKGEPAIKFDADDYLELYNTLRDLGFVVPCKGCFDAAGRFKMLPSVAQKFAAEVNAVIDERNKDPKKFDEKLRKKSVEMTASGLPAKSSNKSDAIAVGVAGDNLTEHIKWTQLMSADGQTKMLSDWGGIFRAWQRTGAGRPKDKLLPEPYYGDIVSQKTTIIGAYGDKTPSFRDILVNTGTGLRRNSHSEFRPVLAVDEIQFMRDAFIKNLTVFKYMKELDDVRLFGKMGVKYNMSFFPEFVPGTKVAGLDKDGNYIASEESVGSREFPYTTEDGVKHYDGMKGFEEAKKYINKDVSLSSVILSIPHLIKALTDVPTPSDWRGIWGSLIPFHSSGATSKSLESQGLGQARANGVGHGFEEAMYDYDKGVTNFEAVQNDRFGEGWEILAGKKAGTKVEAGHKLEFANGTHYYNRGLGVHLFASGYILDSELPAGVLMENGDLNIDAEQKKALMHKFEIDYNNKVREINTPYAYKEAADFYLEMLPKIGLIPRFDFNVEESVFLQMCADANVDPRHPKLGWKGEGYGWSPIDSESYYSVFCDFGMTDPATGELSRHNPVGVVNENGEREFILPDNVVEIVKDGLERFSDVRRSENARVDEAIKAFAERSVANGRISKKDAEKVVGKLNAPVKKSGTLDLVEEAKKAQAKHDAKVKGVSFRITPEMDAAYMEAVAAGDMEAAQRMVDEAAAAAGYTIRGEHGRVSKFTIFDRNKANPEGNWGQGFYFTNNEEDVEENYANVEGPDLEAKIEREVEKRKAQLEQDMDYDSEEDEVDEFAIREAVEEEFITAEPNVVHAAIKMDNPFVVGHGMVEIGEDGLGHYDMNETYLTVEYETDEEGEVDYEADPTGTLVDLVDALNEEISEYDWANFNADEILGNNIDGMTAGQFEQEARELLGRHIDYLTNDKGDIMTSEILRAAIERAGFDGIVDNTVNQKFGAARRYGRSMAGVDEDTRHYIAFESNQIKATDPVTYDDNGNVIPLSERFNPEESDIRFSVVFSSANEELNNTSLSLDNPALMQEYGLSAIELSKKGDYVTLSKIVAEEKGQGSGTRFMDDLTKNADANGWTLALTPDTTYGASSVSRLKKFYKRFGFKENKGRNTDFNTKESMIRIPDGQVMFSVREEGQSAEEFVSSQIDRFVRDYKPEAPIRIADLSSREACAKSLGLSMDDFTEKDYEETLEVAKTRAAAYSPEYKIVAIFVPEAIKNSIVADEIFFHETGHHFIKNNPHLIELGKWLFENSDNGVRRIIAESVREDYTEDRHYEEMLMNFAGKIMSRGRAQKVMDILPDDMKPMWEEFLTRSNYKTEYEDRVRRDLFSRRNGGNQAEYEGTQMRNRDVADRKRPRVTWTKDTRFSTAEITSEEKRKINEFFPGAFQMTDSNGNTLTPEQERFFANSKAVDKDGNLLVLYHGTPRAGFTEFKSGWFTTSKEDAISYSGDRKGRMFDPNEKYEPETLIAGDFPLGYMTFDSEEDRAAFLERFPYADEVMSERDYEDARLGAEDEEYDALTARRGEFSEVWNAYREYERERFVDTTIGELVANLEAYTEEDFMRAMLEYDSNASFDNIDDMSAEERKDALVSALQYANEETEGGIFDMVVPTRVPRNGEGQKHNDLGNRTYEVYANIEKPYEIDANGRGSEFESGDIYKAVEDALADEQYDGAIIRNWKVGRTQQMGDVIVPKNGSQIKLTSNENPTKNSDIRFSAVSSEEFSEEGTRFSIVTDSALLDRLNSEPTIKVYRAMQLIDGKLYPPMSAYVDGVLREPSAEGQWEQAEENAIGRNKKDPSKVDLEQGKGDDGKRRKTSGVLYNPYFHTSLTPLNDQFSGAQTRSNLVIVEVEVPESELTSGYRAEGAANTVGLVDWHSGPIAGVLAQYEGKGRQVILSRWAKPVRIVPESENADIAMKLFEGTTLINVPLPSNVFTPALREELEKRGMEFVETTNNGKLVSDKRRTWSKTYGKKGLGKKPKNETRFSAVSTPTDEVVENGLNLSPARLASLAGDIFAALPEESRKKITDGLNGNILGLQDAILQIPTSLAAKENWNDEDRAIATAIAEGMTNAVGIEMTRPFSAPEALWMLYNAVNKGTDLISEASRALVRRNLGFDPQTLEVMNEGKEGVRFRTVGNATDNARASLYNRGAANVWTRIKESFVDMNASVEKLVKAIEKASGKVAKGFEDVLKALNHQASKGLAAMEEYTEKYLHPMFDEIRRIMDVTDFKYDDIVRYVILKHGLERNEKMAQRDAKAHYQEIYDEIISKINGMNDAQKRTYLTNAQLKDADAKAEVARLKAVDTSAFTDEQKEEHKRNLNKAKQSASEAKEYLSRAKKIATMTEQEAIDELDKIFKKIENGEDAIYKELRKNDYSGISSMFYDTLGVDRNKYATEEEYQSALMEAKADKYDTLGDIEGAAQMEVDLFEKAVNTKVLWKRINAATKETLRQQYQSNLISKDQYENLKDMFEYYVPLRGFADNTAEDMYTYYRKPNSTGYTKPILGAEGRKTEAESPFGWIASMAGSAIASSVKNEAKLALYYFVSNRPDNGIATLSKTWFVHTPGDVDARGKKIFRPAYPPFPEDLSTDAAKQAYEDWQENMRDLKKQGLAYEAGQRLNLGNSVVNIDSKDRPEHIVNVKVGGKDFTIVINGNPRAAQAINGDLNIEATSQDYNALFGPVLRWMSSVNTSYNPEFWITNMQRDFLFTIMAVNAKEDPAYRRKFAKNYMKAFKVVKMVYQNANGKLGNSYIENLYKEFVKYGGVTGYTQIKDNETWEKEIRKYMESHDPEANKMAQVLSKTKDAFHVFHQFGESLEQVSRFAAFVTSREMGKSLEDSISDAKEITVNFNRKGSGKMITFEEAKYLTDKNGRPLNVFEQWCAVGLTSIAPLGRRFIMFFNAAIQGLNSMYRLYKKNPKRMLGWTLAYAVIGAMNALLHSLFDDDDDYLDMPEYERRNSLMIGGNGVYFKWAMPQEARAFYALGDLAVDRMLGRSPHQNVIGEALKIGTEILPINPSEGWKAFLPSVAIPFVELAINEDYKGDAIYNEQKWLSEEERELSAKWSKAYQGTGKMYINIAKVLNNISGGDQYDAGLINVQPEKMEHIVQSAFGGTIRTADKFVNTITAILDPEEEWAVRQTPFLNRLFTINDERYRNVHINDVYDYYSAEAEHVLTLMKNYQKSGDAEALERLKQTEEYEWMKIYNKYKGAVKNYREQLKTVDSSVERMRIMKEQDEVKRQMIREISEL